MSLADAILLTVSASGLCAAVTFIVTVWLADRERTREHATLTDTVTQTVKENARLNDDNLRLRRENQRLGVERLNAEQDVRHARAERDVFIEDNTRLHHTIRRQIGQIKQLEAQIGQVA